MKSLLTAACCVCFWPLNKNPGISLWDGCDVGLATLAFSPHCTVMIPVLSPLLPLPSSMVLSVLLLSGCMRFAEAMRISSIAHCLKISLSGLQEHVKEGRVLWDQPHWQQDQRSVQEYNHGGSHAAILWAGGGRRRHGGADLKLFQTLIFRWFIVFDVMLTEQSFLDLNTKIVSVVLILQSDSCCMWTLMQFFRSNCKIYVLVLSEQIKLLRKVKF